MKVLSGWREEGYREGYKKGYKEGLRLGIQLGIQLGVKKIVLKSLCYKFGQLGKRTLANINKLNTEQLESLIIKVLSSQQLTEIDTWIRQQLASSVGTTSKANGNKKPKTT
jgi:flagellar biosynthesis/type III secretory pathway protein FliH